MTPTPNTSSNVITAVPVCNTGGISARPPRPRRNSAQGSPGPMGYSQGCSSQPMSPTSAPSSSQSSTSSRARVASYLAGEILADGLGRLEERCDLSVNKRLGSGSLGDVVLAIDRSSGEYVAVKVISLEKLRRSGAEEASLRREIQALLCVRHPNIVRLVDVFYSTRHVQGASAKPPYLCIAMDYISGSTPLSVLIRQRGPDAALAHKLLPQLAGALQEMHMRGFVHRDVWSENILVDAEGRCVVVDLGCAALFASGPDVENRMNVPYMSPQAVAGERQQPGDDCWALGIMLTEIVCGRFVADEVGRSDIPVGSNPQVLQKLISETYRIGDRQLGDIASRLLDVRSKNRLQMRELRILCDPGHHIEPYSHKTIPSSGSSTSTVASAKDVIHTGRGLSTDGPLCRKNVNRDSNIGCLIVGQQVNYTARSHSGEYKAVVIGRVSVGNREAWAIRVECGGDKIVEDWELWRIKMHGNKV